MPLKSWSPAVSRETLMEDWQNGGFGIYLHWPFCAAKCPYCDFNSHVAQRIDEADWMARYVAEIDRIAAETEGRLVNTIFLGGGTPSLMSPDLVDAIASRIRHHWPMANDVEFTLEANPGSVEAGRFRAYAEAGVNRLSLGVQALNDEDLRRLGRIHSVAEAKAAFTIARETFPRVSFDLIYARQYQTLDSWSRELKEALSMAVDHLSLYQLTIENGTVFARRALAGILGGLPNEDTAADFYDVTEEICVQAGMASYEVSNYARPGAESRHNTIYWRYGDYAGIGPGAHGRLTLNALRFATDTLRQPSAWLEAVGKRGSGEVQREVLSADDQRIEYVLMGMRLAEGISITRVNANGWTPISARRLDELIDLEMIAVNGDNIRATTTGRKVLNSVIAKLLED